MLRTVVVADGFKSLVNDYVWVILSKKSLSEECECCVVVVFCTVNLFWHIVCILL